MMEESRNYTKQEIVNAIKQAFDPQGCGCIKDMPGDNYTCTAHQLLMSIAREESQLNDHQQLEGG